MEQLLTDEQIDEVWGSSYYGEEETRREIINRALLKRACGYHNGSNSTYLLKELKLVNKNNKITRYGQEYLYEAYNKQ